MTLFVLFLSVSFFLWYFFVYNALVNHRNVVEQCWSNIEVELKRRFDLIENLVSVVKGYASHERDTLEEITSLRARREGDLGDPEKAAVVRSEINSSLTKLVAIAESYPDLKADKQFLELQKQLAETENRIAERRHAYNQSVNTYRVKMESFPDSVIASAHSFPRKEFFDAPDDEINRTPEVKLA